jgi:2-dehydropantoate 2-reductase
MRICIYGAGAVGSNIAVRLISTGRDRVSVIARGAHLASIRDRGLTLQTEGRSIKVRPDAATDDAATLDPQDVVFVGLKAHSLPAEAAAIGRLLAPGGWAAFMNNGIPWWWHHGLPRNGGTLPLLDPEGSLWQRVRPERALGCIVLSGNEIIEPGTVRHYGPERWIFGEPAAKESPRLVRTVELLRATGLEALSSADIRRDIWRKLVLNVSGNPLSAVTRTPSKIFLQDADLRRIAAQLIHETLAVAAALGWDIRDEIDAERAVDPVARAGGGRSSMMQDALLGRRMEVDAILGQTREFARERGVATPVLDIVYPILRGLDRSFAHPKGS